MKPKPTTQSPFTAEAASLQMDRYLKEQKKRDTLQHKRNLELLDKKIQSDIAQQKCLITMLNVGISALVTTITATSNIPPRSENELEKHLDDVVHPIMKEIGCALEFAPPGCDEGFLGPLLEFEKFYKLPTIQESTQSAQSTPTRKDFATQRISVASKP